eukprot:scaffold34760_cov171-Skeletonema_menzelii.AAC.5
MILTNFRQIDKSSWVERRSYVDIIQVVGLLSYVGPSNIHILKESCCSSVASSTSERNDYFAR